LSRRFKIIVCRGPECGDKRQSALVHAEFVRLVAAERLSGPPADPQAEVAWHSCFGACRHGPNVLLREVLPGENSFRLNMMPAMAPGAVLYHGIRPADARRIIEVHLKGGCVLTELTVRTAPDR
jgi:(2Fe-2S) ferredoxin